MGDPSGTPPNHQREAEKTQKRVLREGGVHCLGGDPERSQRQLGQAMLWVAYRPRPQTACQIPFDWWFGLVFWRCSGVVWSLEFPLLPLQKPGLQIQIQKNPNQSKPIQPTFFGATWTLHLSKARNARAALRSDRAPGEGAAGAYWGVGLKGDPSKQSKVRSK